MTDTELNLNARRSTEKRKYIFTVHSKDGLDESEDTTVGTMVQDECSGDLAALTSAAEWLDSLEIGCRYECHVKDFDDRFVGVASAGG